MSFALKFAHADLLYQYKNFIYIILRLSGFQCKGQQIFFICRKKLYSQKNCAKKMHHAKIAMRKLRTMTKKASPSISVLYLELHDSFKKRSFAILICAKKLRCEKIALRKKFIARKFHCAKISLRKIYPRWPKKRPRRFLSYTWRFRPLWKTPCVTNQ